MNKSLHELLLRSDCSDAWDVPEGFDWQSAGKRVESFRSSAAADFGFAFVLDDQIQDASFFADLFEENMAGQGTGIRFSNFNNLALIHTDRALMSESENFPEELIKLLIENGFNVVCPEDIQEARYDGGSMKLHGKITWFTRYFDYI